LCIDENIGSIRRDNLNGKKGVGLRKRLGSLSSQGRQIKPHTVSLAKSHKTLILFSILKAAGSWIYGKREEKSNEKCEDREKVVRNRRCN